MSGHLGAFKTLKKVGRQFYWLKLRDDIFHYVFQCDLCQQAKAAQDSRVGLHTVTPASYPLERVFIDFMGPLVHTRRGNQAIFLVVMDSISKFVAFYLVRNISSCVVCDILESQYFTAYGVPKSIMSDNTNIFRSRVFHEFCFRWRMKRINTTPYYLQGLLAERVMRNLKAALKIFHHQSQRKWDEDLHLLMFAFNTARHEGTKMCPSKLFLGRELDTPLENVWDLAEVNASTDEKGRTEFWARAVRNLRKARD
jgi:hypothetical protein